MKIMIVDDDPLALKSLGHVLTDEGHDITTAAGGQEGIDTFLAADKSGEPFAIAILDWKMPSVNGLQVAAAIKSASPSTPVILFTGWGEFIEDDAEVPMYVDRVLPKPTRLIQLRAALAELRDEVP
jgi:DNA-binding response OmpR family regulator